MALSGHTVSLRFVNVTFVAIHVSGATSRGKSNGAHCT